MEQFYFLIQKQGKGMKKRVLFFFNFIINSMGNLEAATFLPVLWLTNYGWKKKNYFSKMR